MSENQLCVYLGEEIKTTKVLKEFIEKAESPIVISNIEGTVEKVKAYVEKYQNLEVTEENYKTVAKEAEREMREYSVALKAVDKKNGSIHAQARKDEKKNVDTILSIIKPVHEGLKNGIVAIEDKKKEERERKKKEAEERENGIKNAILEQKEKLSKYVRETKGEDHEIIDYNRMIEEFQKCIDSKVYAEFGVIAERDIAIATGERRIIEDRVKAKKIDAEREEEAKKQKILQDEKDFVANSEIRLNQLLNTSKKDSVKEYKDLIQSLRIRIFSSDELKEKTNTILDSYSGRESEIEKKVKAVEKEEEEKRAVQFCNPSTQKIDNILSVKPSAGGGENILSLLNQIDCKFETLSYFEFKVVEVFEKYSDKYKRYIDSLNESIKAEKEKSEKDAAILSARKTQLLQLGFVDTDTGVSCEFAQPITNEEIIGYGADDWVNGIEFIKNNIQKKKDEAEQEEKRKVENIKKNWASLIVKIKELGGHTVNYSAIQIPTSENLADAEKYISELKEKKAEDYKDQLRADMMPFKNKMTEFLQIVDYGINDHAFKHKESKERLLSMIEKMLSAVDETFSSVM